jgi:hypothetical protein
VNRGRIVLLVLASTLPAQSPQSPQSPQSQLMKDTGVRVHSAWLREMLDLDVAGAVADYEAIAKDTPGRPERWIAIARLAELRRMGVPAKPTSGEAPPPIREAFAKLQTPLPPEALRQALVGPVVTPDDTEAPYLFDLRPASIAAQGYVRDETGVALSDLQAQRLTSFGRAGNQRIDPRQQNSFADDVLTAELGGNRAGAETLRRAFFQYRKEPALVGDPATVVARARSNLDAWLKEPNLYRGRRDLLTRLKEELDLRAATDTAAALKLLKKLPIIGDRLLAEPPANTGK